jgi:aspartyl-tRNA(Asn)/glutamyl-tRNA(Gln) amidotransferase subunit A
VNPWTRKYVTDETDETVSKKQTMRVPGGSSGGSAVAVASGVAVAAVGSDTGGSARLPASYCGVVGFKPTYGRVSRWGLVPYCSSLDCPGFLTRTVADAVLMLDATQGRDALDPATLDADERVAALARDVEANVARRVEASKTEAHTKARTSEARTEDDTVSVVRDRGYLRSKPGFPLAGWRVGIPNEYFVAELSDETARAWTETADACERAGASVVPVSLPHTRAALAAYYVIAPAEASSNLARYDGVRFGYRPQEKEKEKEDTYGLSDLSSTSPFASAAATFRGAAFGAETRRRVLVGTFVSGSARVARYVEKAQKVRRAVSDDFRDVFAKVDILLVPTAPATAPPLFDENAENAENADASLAAYAADAMTVPASLAGLPAVSLPVGLGTETGLPVGVQVIAARGNDADALGFAMRLEARVEALGDQGGGAGPEAAADGKAGAVGWGERHRAVGVLEATRFAIGG